MFIIIQLRFIMQDISIYNEAIHKHFNELELPNNPKNLYEPIRYILNLGGKRIRPVLTLMSCEAFGTDYRKALNAATAVEVFHNFSLIHDDIMDEAPLRRGNQTVHEKWNINTGILSGDAMLILAYKYFENYEPNVFQELARLFSKTALQVCEGQQYDVDFETSNDVTIIEYLKMIEYKTAVLVGAALQMGAIVAQTSQENKKLIYDFGLNLGIAFQLQDDYLDAFGNPETFGKQVGGDIIENKKTYLYLKAAEYADNNTKNKLTELFSIKEVDNTKKIETVKQIFENTGAAQSTKNAIEKYTLKAFETLQNLEVDKPVIEKFTLFGKFLMNRNV